MAAPQPGRVSSTTALLVGKLRLGTFHLPVTREPEPGQPQDPSVPSYLAAWGSVCGHSTWHLCPLSSLGILPRQADSAPIGPKGLCPAMDATLGLPSGNQGHCLYCV